MAVSGRGRLIRAGLAAGVFLLTAAVFWPIRQHAWLNYDDDVYITANPNVALGLSRAGVAWAVTTLHGANWFPLTWLSWQLDFELGGLDARQFHTTNLLLHAAAAAVLFLALARLTGSAGRSAFVAAVFGLHPLHVESVAWAAARKDPLSGLFFAAALLAYATGGPARRSAARIACVAGLFALALLAKQTAVTLPLVLLLLDFWPLGRLRRADGSSRLDARALGAAALEKLPLFALAAGFAAAAWVAQRAGGAMAELGQLPLGARAANALVAGAVYLRKAVAPTDLAVFYPHPETGLPALAVAGSAVLLAAATALGFALRRRAPAVAVGWLWYVTTLGPVIGLVQVGSQALADRYTYLPLIGLAIAAAWGGLALLEGAAGPAAGRWIAGALACAAVAALGAGSRAELHHWRDSETLMRRALAVTGDNFVAHAHLGSALLARGEVAEAVRHWRESARLRPDHVTVVNNLAWLLATHRDPSHRDPQQALALAERAAALSPGDPAVLDTLAAAQAATGRFAEAELTARRAAELARHEGRADLAAGAASRADLYRSGRPYLEP